MRDITLKRLVANGTIEVNRIKFKNKKEKEKFLKEVKKLKMEKKK